MWSISFIGVAILEITNPVLRDNTNFQKSFAEHKDILHQSFDDGDYDSIKDYVGFSAIILLLSSIIFNSVTAVIDLFSNSELFINFLPLSIGLLASSFVVGARYQSADIDHRRFERFSKKGGKPEDFKPFRFSMPKNYDLLVGATFSLAWFLVFNIGPLDLSPAPVTTTA